MPATIRKQILDQRQTTLAAIDTIPGLTVDRNRDGDPGADEMPKLVMFDGGHKNEIDAVGETKVRMVFAVQGYVTAARNKDAALMRAALAQALDNLYGTASAALLGDPFAGGLALDTVEIEFADPVFVTDDCDTPFAVFAVDFEVTFVTAEHTPYTV